MRYRAGQRRDEALARFDAVGEPGAPVAHPVGGLHGLDRRLVTADADRGVQLQRQREEPVRDLELRLAGAGERPHAELGQSPDELLVRARDQVLAARVVDAGRRDEKGVERGHPV